MERNDSWDLEQRRSAVQLLDTPTLDLEMIWEQVQETAIVTSIFPVSPHPGSKMQTERRMMGKIKPSNKEKCGTVDVSIGVWIKDLLRDKTGKMHKISHIAARRSD